MKWILIGAVALLVLLGGLAGALWFTQRDTPEGALDTELTDVTVTTATQPPPTPRPPPPKPETVSDELCWRYFGGDPQRSLSRAEVEIGVPVRRHRWTRVLDSYIEYPPSYCDGVLYVNSYRGTTYALDSETGKVLWRRKLGGTKPSTPAIDGPRLLVSSLDGTVTALDRETGPAALAGANRGQRRVLARRAGRHRLLRRDGRPPVRRQLAHGEHPLGVRQRRKDHREPFDLGSPRLHVELRRRGLLPRPLQRA